MIALVGFAVILSLFSLPHLAIADEEKTAITPVLPWEGTKEFGDDCNGWAEIAKLQMSTDKPPDKLTKTESMACKLSLGLECLNVTDDKGTEKTACACQLSIGKHPVTIPNEDGDVQCYIPAGLGWVSQCFEGESPPLQGFPNPYGDPRGSGPDPPFEIDQFNHKQGILQFHYLEWNTVTLRCVPNSECREGANYLGRRCQCHKNSTFYRGNGTCSFASRLRAQDSGRSVVIWTFVIMVNCYWHKLFGASIIVDESK